MRKLCVHDSSDGPELNAGAEEGEGGKKSGIVGSALEGPGG